MVTSQLVSDKNGGTQVFKFGNMPSYYLIEDAPQKLLNYCKTNKQKKKTPSSASEKPKR